jgi:hypothetical protein
MDPTVTSFITIIGEHLLLVGDAGHLCSGRNWKFDSAGLFVYSYKSNQRPSP